MLSITQKGYTGHIQVDHAAVIHMGGRIYDPELGRFMQADPIVQDPRDAQSLNRYTYVYNNPLSYTDPTGYDCHNAERKACNSAIEQAKKDAAQAASQTQGDTKQGEVDSGNGSSALQNSAQKANGQQQALSHAGVTETFISNHVIHKTQRPGKNINNPIEVISKMPKELRAALVKFGQTELGQKVYSQFISDEVSATFIEVTKETAPNFAGVFQAIAEDNEITYTTDVAGYAASRDIRVPGDGLGSATLGSLIAHEFGHTQTGLAAIGQTPIHLYTRKDQSREELRASSLFENHYRRHHGMPERRSYLNENDLLNYKGGLQP